MYSGQYEHDVVHKYFEYAKDFPAFANRHFRMNMIKLVSILILVEMVDNMNMEATMNSIDMMNMQTLLVT